MSLEFETPLHFTNNTIINDNKQQTPSFSKIIEELEDIVEIITEDAKYSSEYSSVSYNEKFFLALKAEKISWDSTNNQKGNFDAPIKYFHKIKIDETDMNNFFVDRLIRRQKRNRQHRTAIILPFFSNPTRQDIFTYHKILAKHMIMHFFDSQEIIPPNKAMYNIIRRNLENSLFRNKNGYNFYIGNYKFEFIFDIPVFTDNVTQMPNGTFFWHSAITSSWNLLPRYPAYFNALNTLAHQVDMLYHKYNCKDKLYLSLICYKIGELKRYNLLWGYLLEYYLYFVR